MKTLPLFISLIFFIGVSVGYAQDSNFNDSELNQISESLSSDYIYASQSTDVTGNPYLNPKFTRGKIQINRSVETGVMFLRFNTEQNIVEFMQGEDYFGVQPNKIDGFTLFGSPDNIIFKNGFTSDDNDINRTTLLRVIYNGEVKLVAHHTTSLKENIASYGSATQKDEYVDHINFYIVQSSGTFSEVNLKRRDILRAFDKNMRDQLSSYADENNLNFDEEADVIKILKHYDELTSDA